MEIIFCAASAARSVVSTNACSIAVRVELREIAVLSATFKKVTLNAAKITSIMILV